MHEQQQHHEEAEVTSRDDFFHSTAKQKLYKKASKVLQERVDVVVDIISLTIRRLGLFEVCSAG